MIRVLGQYFKYTGICGGLAGTSLATFYLRKSPNSILLQVGKNPENSWCIDTTPKKIAFVGLLTGLGSITVPLSPILCQTPYWISYARKK